MTEEPLRAMPTPDRPAGSTTDATESPVARLVVTRILRGDPGRLCQALEDPRWLGHPVASPAPAPGLHRVETDLAFALSDDADRLTFRKAALVDVGVTQDARGSCIGHVEWRAASFAPLFPVFSGTVTAHDGGLHLEGVYAPPGGGVGLLVDRTFLHHFARRTAIWFLDRLIEELREGGSDEGVSDEGVSGEGGDEATAGPSRD